MTENTWENPSVRISGGGSCTDELACWRRVRARILCQRLKARVHSSAHNLAMEEGGGESASDPTQLKKALEWELSLDSRDLRSHAWYHGVIPRARAEEIVQRDGDFLVRDCTSQPGAYVLTCRCKAQGLHFVINKVVVQPDTVYERVQYQFEADAYDTVPDLITYYVGSGKTISVLSGARIQTPQNRLYPLSFYATKYGIQQPASPLSSPLYASGSFRFNPYSSFRSPVHSPPRTRRETPPRLPSKKQRSHSLTPAELNDRTAFHTLPRTTDDRSNSADGVIQRNMTLKHPPTHEKPQKNPIFALCKPRPSLDIPPDQTSSCKHNSIIRVISDPSLSPCLEKRRLCFDDRQDSEDVFLPEQPPPKPSRVVMNYEDSADRMQQSRDQDGNDPGGRESFSILAQYCHGLPHLGATYQASGSDSGNGSGDSAQSSAAGEIADPLAMVQPHRGVIIKNPRQYHHGANMSNIPSSCSSTTLKCVDYDSEAEETLILLSYTDLQMSSAFDLENYQTLLLPTSENKPLDVTALQGVKVMLQETGSRIIANHLTRVDMDLMLLDRDRDFGPGVTSGIELSILPHGHQLRLDLIERTECLKLLVAVTILTCPTEGDRAETLHKWIEVAVDVKTALGNLFGFCGVMMGLCMPQIQRLSGSWHVLRQRFTDSAFNFEAKLRPTLKSMNECTNPQAPNTTIPHVLPLAILQEQTLDHLIGNTPSCNSSFWGWWDSASDLGLGTLFAHMENARKFGNALPTFRRNAEIVLGDSKVDDLLMDAFRTEFHLKFLWGSRGCCVGAEDRRAKFGQVLSAMSDKCEPAPPSSAPTSPIGPIIFGTPV